MLIDKISYQNPMRNLNPLIKFVFTIVVLLALLLVNIEKVFFINFLIFNVIILFWINVSLKELIKLYSVPVFFILTTAFSVYIIGGDVKNFLLRTLTSLSIIYTLVCSTPIVDLDYVFMKVKMPKIFRELFLLVYKYIFILFDVKEKGLNSQKSRLGYINYKKSLKSFSMLVVSIFNKTNYYSYNSTRALESRMGREYLFYHKKYTLFGKEMLMMLIIIVLNIFLVVKYA